MDQLLPFNHPLNFILFSVRLETGQIRGPTPEFPIYSLMFLNSDPCSFGVMPHPTPQEVNKSCGPLLMGKNTHFVHNFPQTPEAQPHSPSREPCDLGRSLPASPQLLALPPALPPWTHRPPSLAVLSGDRAW